MATSRNDELRKRLAAEIEVVADDVQRLHDSVYIFQQLRELRLKNHRLLEPAPFIEWLVENYVHSTAVGVRKQVKNSGISLRALLERLMKNSDILTRANYVAMFTNLEMVEEGLADKQFDEFAGTGNVVVSPEKIEVDVQRLTAKCQAVEYLVDKQIAHYDDVQLNYIPTFGDLEQAVRTLEEITGTYHVLLRHGARLFDVSLFYPWDNVLHFAWKDEREKRER